MVRNQIFRGDLGYVETRYKERLYKVFGLSNISYPNRIASTLNTVRLTYVETLHMLRLYKGFGFTNILIRTVLPPLFLSSGQ
jgi:hypothetical protein